MAVTLCLKYHPVIRHCTTCTIVMRCEANGFVMHECGTWRKHTLKNEVHLTVKCACIWIAANNDGCGHKDMVPFVHTAVINFMNWIFCTDYYLCLVEQKCVWFVSSSITFPSSCTCSLRKLVIGRRINLLMLSIPYGRRRISPRRLTTSHERLSMS